MSHLEEKKDYSQNSLLPKLTFFENTLEKKLEKTLSEEERKTIPLALKGDDLYYSLHQSLSPLQKLKVIKYHNRSPVYGHCIGLCYMLMAHLLLKKDPDDFFLAMKMIILYTDFSRSIDEDFTSKFYFTLKFTQFSHKHTKFRPDGRLNQSHGKEILIQLTGAPVEYFLGEQHKKVSPTAFLRLLGHLKDGKVMRVTVLPSLPSLAYHFIKNRCQKKDYAQHALTLYMDSHQNIYLYDSNYGQHVKKFTSSEYKKIYDELRYHGYEIFKGKGSLPGTLHLNYDIFYIPVENQERPSLNRTTCGMSCWGT